MSKNIKIFVSNRIDMDSKSIDNPLFVPIRCGACFDNRVNVEMQGDNTGDNISEKRESFCELTVQYWAWKNVQADYYGLCHYRRYLSFAKRDIYAQNQKIGCLDSLSKKNIEFLNLFNEKLMRKEIESCDIITAYEHHLADDPKYVGQWDSIYDKWVDYGRKYLDKSSIDLMLRIIEEKYPDIYISALEYIKGKNFIGFNCFIMNKKAFFDFCEFEFDILFDIEKKIDCTNYSSTKNRTPGYLSEWLYSIWIYHQRKLGTYNIKEKQLVFFNDSSKGCTLEPVFEKNYISILYTMTDENINDIFISLSSLIKHSNENHNYDIIICHKSMSADAWSSIIINNKMNIIGSLGIGHKNISIRFYDPKEELLEIDVREFNKQNFEEKFYSIISPWILKEFENVLILSSNTIIECDVYDIKGIIDRESLVSGVKDIFLIGEIIGLKKDLLEKYKNNYNNIDICNFISMDVIFLNLEKVRSIFEHREVVNFIRKNKFINKDIDPINVLFRDKISYIGYEWNKNSILDRRSLMLLNDFIPFNIYEKYKGNADVKIWNKKQLTKNVNFLNQQVQNLYWKYAKDSPFYEEIIYNNIIKNSGTEIKNILSIRNIFDILFPKFTNRRDTIKKAINKILKLRR